MAGRFSPGDLDAIHVEMDKRAYAKEVARLRDGPIVAGIDAATALVGRAIRGELSTPGGLEPGPEGPELA